MPHSLTSQCAKKKIKVNKYTKKNLQDIKPKWNICFSTGSWFEQVDYRKAFLR